MLDPVEYASSISTNLYSLVFQVMISSQDLDICIVPIAYTAALDGVEHLGRMEAEHGSISEAGSTYALICYTERVSCVVYYLKVILISYLLYPFHITEISVYVNRNDSAGIIGYKSLYKVGIYSVVCIIDVAEHGIEAVSYDSMSS